MDALLDGPSGGGGSGMTRIHVVMFHSFDDYSAKGKSRSVSRKLSFLFANRKALLFTLLGPLYPCSAATVKVKV